MQYCPIDILTVGCIVIVHTSGTSIILRAVTSSNVHPLCVSSEDEVDNDSGTGAQLEGHSVYVLAVDVSLVNIECVVS